MFQSEAFLCFHTCDFNSTFKWFPSQKTKFLDSGNHQLHQIKIKSFRPCRQTTTWTGWHTGRLSMTSIQLVMLNWQTTTTTKKHTQMWWTSETVLIIQWIMICSITFTISIANLAKEYTTSVKTRVRLFSDVHFPPKNLHQRFLNCSRSRCKSFFFFFLNANDRIFSLLLSEGSN